MPHPDFNHRHWRFVRRLLLCIFVLAGPSVAWADWPSGRATGGFEIDPSDRFLSRVFFNTVFRASEGTPVEWVGDTAACDQGATSASFKNAVLARVNYFRAMAGVPADLRLRAQFNDDAQEAALLMYANQALDHDPPSDWACWSAAGADAAGQSNLSIGHMGWDAVHGQMTDNGANNARVGHRRWLLYPQTQEIGTGDIPADAGGSPTHALWHDDARRFDPRPATRDDYVAWPPPGFVPYQIVPLRWSISYPGADFSAATLTMSRGGVSVAVVKEIVAPPPGANWFVGENTLVWIPDGLDPDLGTASWPRPSEDVTYSVSVGNVIIGGEVRQFDYDVTVIDPSQPGSEEVAIGLTGPDQPPALGRTRYGFAAVPHAVRYERRTLRLGGYTRIEGAENGTETLTDGTDPAYPLVSTAVSANGGASFHFAHTDESPPQPQILAMNSKFALGPDSLLRFKSRLTWATSDQVAKAQLSIDDGRTWSDLYEQVGTDGPGEEAFTQRQIPLGDYAGEVAMIRFAYVVSVGPSYSWYGYTQDGLGLYLDDIEITNVKRVISETLTDVGPDPAFEFTPGISGDFGLQVRPMVWDDYPALPWGPMKQVTTLDIAPSIAIDPGDIEGYAGETLELNITYANWGLSPLSGVILSVSHDAALQIVGSSPLPDVSSGLEWALTTLQPGESGMLSVSLLIPEGARDGVVYGFTALLRTGQGNASETADIQVNNGLLPDTDGDGIPDRDDPDDDGDGIADGVDEAPFDRTRAALIAPASAVDPGRYGWRYGSASHQNGMETVFQGDGTDKLLHVIGHDIDYADEVGVYLNGQFLGHLSVGPDNADTRAALWWLPAALQLPGENRVEFRQKMAGWKWGVSAIGLFQPGAAFGNLKSLTGGDKKHATGFELHLPASVNGYLLEHAAYDADWDDEIGIALNGAELVGLPSGGNRQWSPADHLVLPPDRLGADGNVLLFHNLDDSAYDWGVRLLRLLPMNAALGNKLPNQVSADRRVERIRYLLPPFTQPMRVTLRPYDTDTATELELLRNGASEGYFPAANNVWGDPDHIGLDAGQKAVLEVANTYNPPNSYVWGVRLDAVEPESTYCIQVITYARNPATGEDGFFPTPCDIPYGWVIEQAPDQDSDGVPDAHDNCPEDANASQLDSDKDDRGDSCDSAPNDPANHGPIINLATNGVDPAAHGKGWGDNAYYSILTARFQGDGTDRLLHLVGYDIDTPDEVAVWLNGELLGYLSPGTNNGYNVPSLWWLRASQQVIGENRLELIQKIPGWKWGIVNIGMYDPGSAFGNLQSLAGGDRSHSDGFELYLPATADGYLLELVGYDVDSGREIGIDLNGAPLVDLPEGIDKNWSSADHLVLPLPRLATGNNVLFIHNRVNPTYDWGVRLRRLLSTNTALGNRLPGQPAGDARADALRFLFAPRTLDAKIGFLFYDIDYSDEVEMAIDGVSTGYAATTGNNSWGTPETLILPVGQRKVITIDNTYIPGTSYVWGVRFAESTVRYSQ